MSDHQVNKSLVLRFYDELDEATGDGIAKVLSSYTTDDYFFRGMHPFYEQHGASAAADVFWKPFRQALMV